MSWFTMLLEFSKPEIINSLKNFSNSQLCFIAVSSVGSPFVIIYCAGAQVGELNICADSTGVGCDDRWTSCPPTMGHSPAQVLPLSQGRDRCCFCCCHCHTHQSGPCGSLDGSDMGVRAWPPGQLFSVWVVCSRAWAHRALCCLVSWLLTHCFIVPSDFTYSFKDKMIKNSRE